MSDTHQTVGLTNAFDLGVALDSTPVYQLEPLSDSRWPQFLTRHPRATVFHSNEWLEALHRTYRYKPVALTTCSPSAELRNAVVFCHVDSWATGRRLVSLPFSDHCNPLMGADEEGELSAFIPALETKVSEGLRYIEIRSTLPLQARSSAASSCLCYCFHQLDLRPDLAQIFDNCHKDSTQRKMRRAEREGLGYEEGRSRALLDSFYELMLATRRRQLIPPAPKRWFQNLLDCFGEAVKIRAAFHSGEPIAAILTLRFKDTVIYKYGCSNRQYHHLGGMHLLFWKTIQEAKEQGLRTFDLGRSDCRNEGLITFKDRWGATRKEISYLRMLPSEQSRAAYRKGGTGWKYRFAAKIFPRLPDRLLSVAGNLIYRHIG